MHLGSGNFPLNLQIHVRLQLIAYREEEDSPSAPAKGKMTAIGPQRLLKLSAVSLVLLDPVSFRKCTCHSSQGEDSYHPGRRSMSTNLQRQLSPRVISKPADTAVFLSGPRVNYQK